jgi:hypothetical protein
MTFEDKLYIIVNNSTSDYTILDCIDIFKNLEFAKQMLINLYNSTFETKYFNYHIKVYKFVNNKYEITDECFTYEEQIFFKHS